MYFLSKNNFFHGVMFHHFHNSSSHLKGQGSISKNDLVKIIKFIGINNIISPDEAIKFVKNKENIFERGVKKVCLTFDDSLKCQYDIALPILEKYKIKAFFLFIQVFF